MSDDTPARGARPRKSKTPPELDLPAAAVNTLETAPMADAAPASAEPAPEVAPQPEEPAPAPEAVADPEPATEPAPVAAVSAPAAPSRLLPAALGLVAGLVGGLGGALLAPRVSAPVPLMSAPDTGALNERIARAEGALNDAKGREEALRGQISALNERLASESAAARKAVDTLQAQLAKPAVGAGDIDALKGRLGRIEGDSQVLPKELDALGARLGTVQPKLETLEKTVEALGGRLASVGSRDALAQANGRLAAQSLLEEDFAAGRPYPLSLDLIARTGGEPTLLALLRPFAESGAPSPAALREAFNALRPKAAEAAPAEGGILDKARKAALSLVEVRQTGQATGAGDAGIMARVDQALARGELSAALDQSAAFSPAMAPAFAAWRGRLETRIRAGEAVVQLRKDARAALARAAASAAR